MEAAQPLEPATLPRALPDGFEAVVEGADFAGRFVEEPAEKFVEERIHILV